MELLHRAVALQELDGVDRLHRVGEPEPVQSSYPIQNLQSIPAETLAQWRDQYIASNGTLNPATQLVPNPFQPASGPLLPFAGALGAATIARQNTLFPYPLLIGSNAAVDRSGATADYHAMVLRVSRGSRAAS